MTDTLESLDAERKHHENTAGCLRTDLEYVTRERDDALRHIEAGDILYKEACKKIGEQIARAETVERERDEARAKLAEYEAALNSIACFDDEGGSQRLTNTGSYSGFDEPGSVRIAREVVAKAAAIHNRSTT